MIALFNEYKEKGKIQEALLIGRNMVNRDPRNKEKLELYLNLLFYLAENLPLHRERKQFVGQAEITLSFFSENADLNEELVKLISEYEKRIKKINENLLKEEKDKQEEIVKNICANNNKILVEFYQMKQKLEMAKEQKEFDKILLDIATLDSKLVRDYLSEEQNTHYEQLNKEFNACISDKMKELEYKENIAYNKAAVEAYDKAFKKFKSDEGKYKNQTELFQLVSSTLFAYNASRLFNETLIYYNHIYSYIFGKLNDDGKLALTRFSIECERKLR